MDPREQVQSEQRERIEVLERELRRLKRRLHEIAESLVEALEEAAEGWEEEATPPYYATDAEVDRPSHRYVVQGINDRGREVTCRCDVNGCWRERNGEGRWVPTVIRHWWRVYR